LQFFGSANEMRYLTVRRQRGGQAV
jgi:hypothetical protein